MPVLAVVLLAVGTYAFRVTGPLFHDRLRLPARLEQQLAIAAAVLLIALAAVSGLTEDQHFAGWSRLSGVLVALLLAIRRLPLPLVVVAAAATTALLRQLGVT